MKNFFESPVVVNFTCFSLQIPVECLACPLTQYSLDFEVPKRKHRDAGGELRFAPHQNRTSKGRGDHLLDSQI